MTCFLHRMRLAPLVLVVLLHSQPGWCWDDAKGSKESVPVAKQTTETASMLRQANSGKLWEVVPGNSEINSGQLLLGSTGATLVSKNGNVQLSFLGNLDGLSPLPIVESVIMLHPAKDVDLDVTLDRGRIDLTNLKKKGAARVRVHIRGRAGEIVLNEPGSQADLEIYGRWPRGVPFNKNPKPGEGPTLAFVVLALKGDVTVKARGREISLKAPPGPALLIGDNIDDDESHPQHLDRLPEWATGTALTERGQKTRAAVAKFRKLATEKSVSEAATALAHSDDETERRVGVNLLAATDDLLQLAQAMVGTKRPDVWDNSVMALRHWIGRGPGQDQKLYARLIEEAKFPPHEAEIILNLLHSFGEADLARPETYEALIDYLGSDRLAVRSLAVWHLIRLVPEGKKFGYNALASKEDRDKAIKQWQTLIPSGKLPPRKPRAGGDK